MDTHQNKDDKQLPIYKSALKQWITMLLNGNQITLFNLNNADESLTILLVRWAVQVLPLHSLNIREKRGLSKNTISESSCNIMLYSFRN